MTKATSILPLRLNLCTTLGYIPLISHDGLTHGTMYEVEEDFRIGGVCFHVEAIRLVKGLSSSRWQAVNPAFNHFIEAYYAKINGDPTPVYIEGYPFYVHLTPHPAN